MNQVLGELDEGGGLGHVRQEGRVQEDDRRSAFLPREYSGDRLSAIVF